MPRRVSLFEVVEETPSPTPTAVQTTGFVPVVTVTPSPTPTPVYGPFTPIEEPFTLEMDIFPTAEKALGLDITAHYDNELWSVRETEDAFIIEARRYGHGVGDEPARRAVDGRRAWQNLSGDHRVLLPGPYAHAL